MLVKEKLNAFEMFDVAILWHGFTAYMRDYDVIVEVGGTGQGRYRYRFTHCPEANVSTQVSDEVWQESWDDLYTDYQKWLDSGEPEGFVWGASWSMAYPGLSYLDDSPLAAEWAGRFGKPMHEVVIETEVFRLKLIFHDVIIQKLSDEVNVIDKAIIPLSG